METTVFTLYGHRNVLAALAAIILDDENVEAYEIHKDNVEDYAFITLTEAGEDLQIGTYEAIEGYDVTYEITKENAA